MGKGNIRNAKCACGSGNKYKKCCLEKDRRRHKINERVKNASRKDFISEPYKQCPNPACLTKKSFGVFTPIEGSNTYTRECIHCGYRKDFNLPNIRKNIVYLDQFIISNLVKLLDKSHSSHKKIKSDPFWEALFTKLEAATRSQTIVCPDSFIHKDESLVGNIDFKLMSRLYEHFSSGKTLYPSAIIGKNQMISHFEKWLNKEKYQFKFEPSDISFERDLHSWSIGLRISVGGNPYPGQIENLHKVNAATKNRLKEVWERWQSEKHISFLERVKEETLSNGKSLISVAKQFIKRREDIAQKIAAEKIKSIDDINYDDFIPTVSNEIIDDMRRIMMTKNIREKEFPQKIAQYFSDFDSLIEIPQIRIGSIMFAGLAHHAKNGKKKAPKSVADVQFISSYLPYCDALFVDKESALLLKNFPKDTPSNLKLKEFPAKIFSLQNKNEFLNYLDGLVRSIPHNQTEILKDVYGDDYAEPYWSIIEDEKIDLEDDQLTAE